MNIYQKLTEIQHELKCNKGQYNSFGNYKYRSCEDILEAVKPLCHKYKTVLVVGDEIVSIGDRVYVKATATMYDTEGKEEAPSGVSGAISNTAYARESLEKKGLDASQITRNCLKLCKKILLGRTFIVG